MKMIWGLSLRVWEDLMRGSIFAVGVFGLIAGFSTWFVVKLQRAEIAESAKEMTKYKADVALEVEEARNKGIEAGKAAGDALLRAAELEKQAAEANAALSKAQVDIERSKAEAEQLKKDTAVANARGADAQLRVAEVNREAARLQADNLALQTVLLPRHVGLIGIDEQPKAQTWFAGFERWAGTKVLIQVAPGDSEAQNLANEIAIVLGKFGWAPAFIDEKRSGVSLNLSEGLSVISPSSYKAWDPKDEAQQTFAALGTAATALARALTNAGLGVGSYPVSGVRGLSMVVDFPPESEGEAHNPFRNFFPRLDGVYLQVGSRPVGATMAWIKQGRPDILGNKAADAAPAEAYK
ncbi:hypothetical protein [Bradyrhizobium ganzhouense]|uniref:hypothetical protein n=1 Tax=Bradyrhizobium ganzhouense TaxID=1179767 RepID=UPI003CE9346C